MDGNKKLKRPKREQVTSKGREVDGTGSERQKKQERCFFEGNTLAKIGTNEWFKYLYNLPLLK